MKKKMSPTVAILVLGLISALAGILAEVWTLIIPIVIVAKILYFICKVVAIISLVFIVLLAARRF